MTRSGDVIFYFSNRRVSPMMQLEEETIMEASIRSGELYVSEWMQSFVDTTVRFAVWHARPEVEHVSVGLSRRGDGRVGCRLDAWRADGTTISVAAVDAEPFAAIQDAADRLEVALFAPSQQPDDARVAA